MNNTLSGRVKNLSLFSAVLPFLAMILVNTMSSPINTFVSSIIPNNETAVESIGMAGSAMNIFGMLLSLLSGGAGIIIGQYIGKKVLDRNLKYATDSTFFINLFIGLVIAILTISLNHYLMLASGAKEGTPQMNDGMLYIYIIGSTFLLNSLQGYYLGTTSAYGYPIWSMIIGISMTVTDLVLSILLVYFANIGILGTIIGTVIARVYALIFSMVIYSIKVQPFWKTVSFNWKITKKIIKISVPIATESISFNTSMFIQAVLIGNIALSVGLEYGGHNYLVWSRSIYNTMQALSVVGSVAFALGMEVLVSRKMGEKKYEEAKRIVKKSFLIALAIDIPFALLIFLIQRYFISFLTTNVKNEDSVTTLRNQLYWSFLILIPLEFGRAANIVYIAASRCAGDAKFTALTSIPISWVAAVLVPWLLVRYTNLGWTGVAIGMMIDECLRGIVNYSRWKSNAWKKKMDQFHKEHDNEQLLKN